jgi:glycosyltransferase involved in cell wall biosynthesis
MKIMKNISMKYSIVTPVYNGEKYIHETIKSVIYQEGDFDIEYIIVDGNSSDKTIEIIKEYEEKIKNNAFLIKCNGVKLKWISEKDKGMYNAINKGFDIATGEIYAWINSDDKYLPKAFETMKNVFEKYKDIDWVKGRTVFIDRDAKVTNTSPCFIFNREWISRGIYGRYAYFIHQDSVFWRSKLWNQSGKINTSLKYAGDYDLWCKFAKYTSLWSVDTPVSIFRQRDGQLSGNMTNYRCEQENIRKTGGFLPRTVMFFFFVQNKLAPRKNSLLFCCIYKILFNKRMKQYITIKNSNKPEKVKAFSYISVCK